MILRRQVPLKYKLAALWQWVTVSVVLFCAVCLGFLMAALACITSKKMKNAFNEESQRHARKYIDQGSSGEWEYWASSVPVIRWWSNYEDGDLREPSGKGSVRCKGKERTFWNRYKWNAFGNPFNMGKRTLSFFHCLVDECTLAHFGDYNVTDKQPKSGWQFVIATHKATGKKYYGYYSVKYLGEGKVRVHRYGFKIKPSHATHSQDADDKDKAVTFRYQHASVIN